MPTPAMDLRSAAVEFRSKAGDVMQERAPMALGNPQRPMSWDDMGAKFMAVVQPIAGDKAEELFRRLRRLDEGGDLSSVAAAVGARP